MRRFLLLALLVVVMPARESWAVATLSAPFDSSYSLLNLGSAPGVPGQFGGLVLKADDPNTLLIGGAANGGNGAIYSIGLTRDGAGHITGFSGSASFYASAPNIDGGLAYGPGGVLFYTAYPTNQIGQIKPGSTSPDKIVSAAGVSSSVGSLLFAPDGSLKILSYSGGGFYTAEITPDGTGTYDISEATLQSVPGRGPEGAIYVPTGSPLFATPSMLISEYGTGTVGAYKVGAGYAPDVDSRVDFITGLSGAEGAFVDPLTGDFLFSTFGSGNEVFAVRGFAPVTVVPEPSTIFAAGFFGLAGLYGLSRRSKSKKSVA